MVFFNIISPAAPAIMANDFLIWLVTGDKTLAERWCRLFIREYLNASVAAGLAEVAAAGDVKALLFAEAGPGGIRNAAELSEFVSRSSNISVIAFTVGEKPDDALTARYLEAGADDFIASSIDERVLLCKTRAHLRRLLPLLSCARAVITTSAGDLEVNKRDRSVSAGRVPGKRALIEDLTPKEFDILAILVCNEGRVVSRPAIMEAVWKEKAGKVNCETIDKHVETLRGKLGPYGSGIRTVYGTGYVYKSGTPGRRGKGGPAQGDKK